MLTYWALTLPLLLLTTLLPLRAAGASVEERTEQPQQRSFNVDLSPLQQVHEESQPGHDGVRRFECPAGFFRLRRNCYYLSGGTAQWREAHFQCTARNATLAVLNHDGKNKILGKYLMGKQFRRLERWIGGIYNWRQMNWEWGVSGEKVLFQNFGNPDESISKNYAWHCIVLDPAQQYMWSARSCLEQKYYICEVPAGRIGKSRRRKNIVDPLAPQNQRLRPSKKDMQKRREKMREEKQRKNKLKSMRKKTWYQHEDNQVWAHGIKPGSRPPKGSMRTKRPRQGKGPRGRNKGQRHNRKHAPRLLSSSTTTTSISVSDSSSAEPRIAQVTPRDGEFGAFPADGHISPHEHLHHSLIGGTGVEQQQQLAFPRLFGSDFTREEILLKI